MLLALAAFLFWSVCFGLAFGQWPLYSENQNTKFLHGLAQHGMGYLAEDWLAQTVDPLPVFSFLVGITYRLLPQVAFHAYHVLLLGVYLHSLVGIASFVYPSIATRTGRIVFSTLVIALHSSLLPPFSWRVTTVSLGWLLQSGVANQYLLNPVFQPSTFGVLLVLSVYVFLRDRPVLAAILAAIAAVFHSTYMPAAAVLTACYMLMCLADEKRNGRRWPDALRPFLGIGFAALAVIAPVLVFNAVALGPTSAEAWRRSQEIIVRFRIPHHSLPEIWIDTTVYLKILIVVVALGLLRKTRLFPVLLLSFVAATLLTWLQIETGNDTLAFVAPWRISVFLVPLASCLIMAALLSAILRWLAADGPKAMLVIASLALLAVLVSRGTIAVRNSFRDRARGPTVPMLDFVRQTKTSGEVYLIPTSMAEFRLYTGAPVVVTWKSHPYKDVEVIEWQERVSAVNDFYSSPSCEKLDGLTRYGVTHIVLEAAQSGLSCPGTVQLYRDDYYVVLRLAPELPDLR